MFLLQLNLCNAVDFKKIKKERRQKLPNVKNWKWNEILIKQPAFKIHFEMNKEKFLINY